MLILAGFVHGQQALRSFAEIDERVKLVEPAAPAALAHTLTKDYTTDREKLRALFSWITEHIAYRVKKNRTAVNSTAARLLFTDSSQWKSANDMVAETVLQNRSAVCDGYARLFKTLCDYAGLRSAIVLGFAKGDLSRQPPFRTNHTWNAVYIDSAWRLLDVTWASGYTSYNGDEFFKRFDETYFLAAPETFIQDHFPEDLRWTLMLKPPLPREFSNAPYKNRPFGKYKITSFAPQTGIIEAAVGDTVRVDLETADFQADTKMAADTIIAFDSAMQSVNPLIRWVEPIKDNKNNYQLHYQFCIENSDTEWLHIVYNHDTILRYRLRIRPAAAALAGPEKPYPATYGVYP